MSGHTFRGYLDETHNFTKPFKLRCDNGSINQNFVVVDFQVWPCGNVGGGATILDEFIMVLGTTPEGAASAKDEADPRDSRQIAWAYGNSQFQPTTVLDPLHIITEDLFINGWDYTTGGARSNLPNRIGYMVTIVPVEQSSSSAIVAMMKESAQN